MTKPRGVCAPPRLLITQPIGGFMTAKNSTLTHARLREVLHYDPMTGVFTWRKNRQGGVRAGDKAGCKSASNDGKKRYLKIRIDRVLYHAHRLAWFYVHGVFPSLIDHRTDDSNALVNLRIATSGQNNANSPVRKNNASGFKGVRRHCKNRWAAQIKSRGINQYLGLFESPKKAAEAYDAAAIAAHGDFAKTNKMLGLLS